MDFLKTTETGGHPLNLEDLGFIQEGERKAQSGSLNFLAASVGFSIVGFSGITALGGNAVSSGVAFVNANHASDPESGEMMFVQALATNPDRSVFDYYIEDIPDPVLDPTTYLDTSSKNVQVRYAIFWHKFFRNH